MHHHDVLGSFMVFAWGAVAPVGLMLSLFYKVVWPGGEWFYVCIYNNISLHPHKARVTVNPLSCFTQYCHISRHTLL